MIGRVVRRELEAVSMTGSRRRWLRVSVLLVTGGMGSVAPLAAATGAASSQEIQQPPPLPGRLTLEEARRLASQNRPELRSALATIEVVRADSVTAREYRFNPELEVGVARGGGSVASGDESIYGFEVTQEIELWGKRGDRRSLAGARLRTAESELEVLRQKIDIQVRTRFQRTIVQQQRVSMLRELVALERQVVNSTQARVRDGSVTPLSGRLTELDGLRIDAELVKAASARRQALVNLAAALGGRLQGDLELLSTLAPDSLSMREDSIIARALVRRREAEALRRRFAEGRAVLQVARVEGRPNLIFGAGLLRERVSFDSGDFLGDPGGLTGIQDVDHLWQARVLVPLPLWQRNRGEQARAAAEMTLAQRELERFQYELEMEVRAAVRGYNDAVRLLNLYLPRQARVRDDLAMVRAAYVDGRIALESYLTHKERLVETLLGQLEAEDRYWEARGALEEAAGADLTTLQKGGSR